LDGAEEAHASVGGMSNNILAREVSVNQIKENSDNEISHMH
jgi:hypothetical protein